MWKFIQPSSWYITVKETKFFALVTVEWLERAAKATRGVKTKKCVETKHTPDQIAILSLARADFVAAALSAHGLQNSYIPGSISGPNMKISWSGSPFAFNFSLGYSILTRVNIVVEKRVHPSFKMIMIGRRYSSNFASTPFDPRTRRVFASCSTWRQWRDTRTVNVYVFSHPMFSEVLKFLQALSPHGTFEENRELDHREGTRVSNLCYTIFLPSLMFYSNRSLIWRCFQLNKLLKEAL